MVATELDPTTPTAVFAANRAIACSVTARAEGIRRGTRRRDAQSRCPDLAVFDHDPDRDARLFEPVAAAVEELAPGVEVVRSGVVAVAAKGPVGYFGGEEAAAEQLIDHVAYRAGVECQVGIADGLFAATLAAHRGVLVPPGQARAFLAPLSVGELAQPAEHAGRRAATERTELVDLLHRMGIRTLGAFAAIPEPDVASRFGGAAVLAHRLASGRAERPLDRRRPPPDLVITVELDPPADRVDAVAFAARAAAQRLYDGLIEHDLACTRLAIRVRTESGQERERVWRCAEPLTLAGIADRVRWQLDGWLRAGLANRAAAPPTADPPAAGRTADPPAAGLAADPPPAGRTADPPAAGYADEQPGVGHDDDLPSDGISELRLAPEEVVDGRALQFGLWSGAGADADEETERAGRALVRVQGLLGPEAVYTAVLGGGRGPGDQVRLVPWGDERVPGADPAPPWPGRLPAPSPATVPADRVPARVLDARGAEVGVGGNQLLTAVPHRVSVAGAPPREVRGWAGPWPVIERWWEPGAERRAVRLQVLVADGSAGQAALLLLREGGRWLVEGMYD